LTCQVIMFREVMKLCPYRDAPYFFQLGWLVFLPTLVAGYLCVFTMHPQPLLNQLLPFVLPVNYLVVLYAGCFFLCLGTVLFVLIVVPGREKQQYQALGWMLWTIIVAVGLPLVHVINMQRNLIWFILPAALVVTNDMNAYLFGFLFGKHPLIKISPRKTWEGFIGGGVATGVIAFAVMQGLKWVGATYGWPSATGAYLSIHQHALPLAAMTSLITPFGGLFASGFKRAHDQKDFGDLIPGHGGITDRMDCQMLNGLLVFAYAGLMQQLRML